MPHFVYIPEICRQQIKKHGVGEIIGNLQDRVEQEQNTSFFENFPAPFIKRKIDWNLRLIASIRTLAKSEDVVVVFHRVVPRGDVEYGRFIADPRKFGEKNFQEDWNEDTLRSWLHEERQRFQPKPKSQLNDRERQFIWHTRSGEGFNPMEGEYFIYESTEWVRSYSKTKERFGYETIRQALVDHLTDTFLAQGGTELIPISGTESIAVRVVPAQKLIFIFCVVESTPQLGGMPADYTLLWEQSDLAPDDVYRNSLRAYPYFLLVDERWSEIQDSASTNLALSPEEKEVLLGALSTSQDSGKGFPLFLNGRAGSGKSTVLQYLFTEYVSTYLSNMEDSASRPIYLSYSPQLIVIARQTVTDLLRLSHRFGGNSDVEFLRQRDASGHPMFLTFSTFLRSMLPEEAKERFNEIRYVSYSKFIAQYNERFKNEPRFVTEYNGDLCWHVIRTFIKGYSSEEYLDENDYKELGKARSVSSETFQQVYDKVWQRWYKDLTTGAQSKAWDDLDLVRYLLKERLVQPRYNAIFCDEAQDFTQIELDLLYRSSIYSDRQISLEELKKVPLAFAGDQFQTLNPTGFKWGSIRALYTDKFIRSLVPWDAARTSSMLHYRELKYNYRSHVGIVKACNSLQLLRKRIFDIEDIEPQLCWNPIEQGGPQLVFNHPKAGEYIRNNQGVRIIVPCNLGEEEEYFNGDSFLLDFAPRIAGFPLTVESAMRAKGQEYDEVIVYGFGKQYLSKQFPSLDSLRDDNHAPETLLELEYFFNKLYVAMSRAKKKLFIIDSEQGWDAFWKYLTDENRFNDFIPERILDSEYEMWNEYTGFISESSSEDLALDNIAPEMLARQKEDEGIRKQDSYLLKQAAGLYAQVKNAHKASFCSGMACELMEEYAAAGEHFQKCQENKRAFKCYWLSNDYKKASAVAQQDNSLKYGVQAKFAALAISPNVDEFAKTCATLSEACANPDSRGEFFVDERYRQIVDQALHAFLQDRNIQPEVWKRIYSSRKALSNVGIMVPNADLARAAHKAGFVDEAILLFEESGDTNSSDYKQAIGQLVRDKLQSGQISDFSVSEKAYAAEILIKEKRNLDLAAKLLFERQKGSNNFKPSEFEPLFSSAKGEEVRIVASYYYKSLLGMASYSTIIKLLENSTSRRGNLPAFVTKAFEDKVYWSIEFVKEIAISEELPKQKFEDQNRVIDFLKKLFISDTKDVDWQIDPRIAGAAFERSRLFVPCDQYYEKQLKRENLPYVMREELALRRVKVLRNLAERTKEPVNRERYEKDAKHLVENYKLQGKAENIPPYPFVAHLVNLTAPLADTQHTVAAALAALPTLSKLHVAENNSVPISADANSVNIPVLNALPDEVQILSKPMLPDFQISLGDIELHVDRKNGKIILRHPPTNTYLFYLISKGEWKNPEEILVSQLDDNRTLIPDWEVSYSSTLIEGKILIEFKTHGIETAVNCT
jgi:hypothetical protein